MAKITSYVSDLSGEPIDPKHHIVVTLSDRHEYDLAIENKTKREHLTRLDVARDEVPAEWFEKGTKGS